MRQRARVIERERMSAEEYAKRLESVIVTIPMRVGEENLWMMVEHLLATVDLKPEV